MLIKILKIPSVTARNRWKTVQTSKFCYNLQAKAIEEKYSFNMNIESM